MVNFGAVATRTAAASLVSSLLLGKRTTTAMLTTTRAMSSTGTASPHHKFTYQLGQSLYVPLTSVCTPGIPSLPASRGPKFCLPAPVVAALCRVRDAEYASSLLDSSSSLPAKWEPWCNWLDTQDEGSSSVLPPPDAWQTEIQKSWTERRPTVLELVEEIDSLTKGEPVANAAIVIAGEGEPLMRCSSLLELITCLRTTPKYDPYSLRLVTNGHVPPTTTTQRAAHQLHEAGLNVITIALPPNLDKQATKTSDVQVCDFIRACTTLQGWQVEVTAVDRLDSTINRNEAQDLAHQLGVTAPIRWRSYCP